MRNPRPPDIDVLYAFVKLGLPHKKVYSYLLQVAGRDPKGFRCWETIKKYDLLEQKGRLFLYTKTGALQLLKAVMKQGAQVLDQVDDRARFSKYENTVVRTTDEEALHVVLGGTLRNQVQQFFDGQKSSFKHCQFPGCASSDELEAAHHHSIPRKELFMKVAQEHRREVPGGCYEYPILEVILEFLRRHQGGKVLFLCRTHHQKYDALTVPSEQQAFVKAIWGE